MKVKKMNALTKARIENSLLKIQNYLGEKGKGLVDELRAIFDEMEASEAEISDEELKNKINEVLKASEVFASAEDLQEIANKLAKLTQGAKSVANGIAPAAKKAILNAFTRPAKSFQDLQERVMAVAVANDITGLTFGEIVSYTIADKIDSQNKVFDMFRQVPFTKVFYTEADLATAGSIAKAWKNPAEGQKKVQELTAKGKAINTEYIYKRQRVAESDLDAIREDGGEAELLRFITEELYRITLATIVNVILLGDTVNAEGDKITTFETIGTKTATDLFTTVINPETAGDVELGDIVRLVRSLRNPEGKEVVLFIDPNTLNAVSKFVYAEGGTTDYRTEDELKVKLGVAEIVRYDLHTATQSKLHAVAMIPDGYWIKTRREKQVSWPQYDRNEINWMYERNTGGTIRDLQSTAVLRSAE